MPSSRVPLWLMRGNP